MAGEFIDEGYGSAPNSPMMSPQGGGAVDPLGLGIGGSPYGLGGYGGGFALIVVLFILLIIVGCVCFSN